ncbi:MAG: trimeric autotransporter adhesin [Actinomycetota bacterium]|nr:trimeric autotransporter adhesin [Actinomycetota bacterium]
MHAALVALALASVACGSVTTGTAPTTATVADVNAPPPPPPSSRLVASDGAEGDNFGGALWYNTFEKPVRPVYYATAGEAAMSSDGTVALVGVPGHTEGSQVGVGAAYVFKEVGGHWTQTAKLLPEKRAAYDGFGWSVALSGDGKYALVGAPHRDTRINEDIGGAYVFHESGGTWSQVALIRPPGVEAYDEFGSSVAFSRDGSTALVGAPSHKVGAFDGQGAAYVMRKAANGWSAVHQLVPTVGEANANFGAYVALSANGSIALVTRLSHFDAKHVYRIGATYLYSTADAWAKSTQRALFPDPNQNTDKTTDAYGVNAVLSDDGKVAAVAAPDVNVGKEGGAGATYLYTTTGDWGTPSENATTTLLPPDPVQFGYYGSSVALSADGKILWIGVDGAGSNAQGEGFVVRPRTNGGAGRWRPESFVQTLVAAPHRGKGRFGTAVAISADASTLLSTSPWLNIGANVRQGAAFVIRLAPQVGQP